MNNQTSQVNPSQTEPAETITTQDGTELYDSHTPDSYDPHIIPAETAARKEHEGANFKHLAKHSVGTDHINTSGGFMVDKEGLMDNIAIEPEMYYETPGDLETHDDLSDSVDKVRQEGVRGN